jgi:parallel beta-helix repeat protein
MTTYYVRKDGNDTTGDGSTGAPWLTITKALATVSAAGGHTIKVGAGTYNEDSSGFFYITKRFTAFSTIESESGNAADVIIMGASSTTYNVLFSDNCYRIEFKNVSFISRTTGLDAVQLLGCNNIKLTNCIISTLADANGKAAIRIQPSTSINNDLITIENCTISAPGANTAYGIYLQYRATYVNTNISITNCTITANTIGIYANYVTGLALSGGSVQATNNVAVLLGADGEIGNPVSGTISGVNVIGGASHAFLIGAGCNGVTVTNCVITGGDEGLIFKECVNCTATGCTISNSTDYCVYFKAADTCTLTNCNLNNFVSDGIQINLGGTGNTNTDLTITNNKIKISGDGKVFNFVTAAMSTGIVSDYNTYKLGAAKFGVVLGDADVQNLAELRAAWATYDVTTNDSHSKMWSDGGAMLLFMRKR